LQVTEEDLLAALRGVAIKTLKDMRTHTGAGDGCTVCHQVLRTYLEEAAA
jgi:bacterioferritin-associated ferredoxin